MKKIETRPDGSVKVMTLNDKPSKAQQQFKQMTDVNDILRRYKVTGDASLLAKRKGGVYADWTGIGDYQSSLHKVMEAKDKFMALPSELRKKFDNDPQKLLEFVNDVGNYKESVALGLRHPDPSLEPKEPGRPDPAGSGGQVPPVTPPPASQPKQ